MRNRPWACILGRRSLAALCLGHGSTLSWQETSHSCIWNHLKTFSVFGWKRYARNDILFLMFQDIPCILKASFSTCDHVKFISRQFQSLMKSYSNSNTEFVTITFLLKEKQKKLKYWLFDTFWHVSMPKNKIQMIKL